MVQLNRSTNGLLPDKRSVIFRACESVLMNEPTLFAVTKTWKSWRGDADDCQPISREMCPAIRLTLKIIPGKYLAQTLQMPDVNVIIEAFTGGTCIDDAADYWGLVENALAGYRIFNPGASPPQTVQQFLRTCYTDPNNVVTGAFNYIWQTTVFADATTPAGPNHVLQVPQFLTSAGIMTLSSLKPA